MEENEMKKIQVPIILPVILALAVAVLGGVILYMSFKDTGNVKQALPPQVTQASEIDVSAVHNHLTNAKNRLDSLSAIKSSNLKGEIVKLTVADLKQAQTFCTDKEESLRYFLTTTALALDGIGQRLSYGIELTDKDSSNLSAVTKAIADAHGISHKALDEYNKDYLRGEFSLPELMHSQAITKEQAQTIASKAVANPVLKEESEAHYSFSADNYILEVSKADGTMMYRSIGYEQKSGELTAQNLDALVNKAKSILEEKGFKSTVLMEWQSGAGEISMKLYPIENNIVYMNTPLGIVLSLNDGSLLGLKLSLFTAKDVKDNDKLLSKIKDTYKDYIYISKGIDEHGLECYMVGYENNGIEYISTWDMKSEKETKAVKYENTSYGRHLVSLDK